MRKSRKKRGKNVKRKEGKMWNIWKNVRIQQCQCWWIDAVSIPTAYSLNPSPAFRVLLVWLGRAAKHGKVWDRCVSRLGIRSFIPVKFLIHNTNFEVDLGPNLNSPRVIVTLCAQSHFSIIFGCFFWSCVHISMRGVTIDFDCGCWSLMA